MNILKKEAGAENGGSTGIDCSGILSLFNWMVNFISDWMDLEVMVKMLKVKKVKFPETLKL